MVVRAKTQDSLRRSYRTIRYFSNWKLSLDASAGSNPFNLLLSTHPAGGFGIFGLQQENRLPEELSFELRCLLILDFLDQILGFARLILPNF